MFLERRELEDMAIVKQEATNSESPVSVARYCSVVGD